jgi:glycosyltransferase involved in cell wall biosynthesis
MKILFVNNFKGRGGGEEFLRDLLPGLVRKGVHVGLICQPNAPLTNMFKGLNIDLYPISRSGIDGLSSVFKTAKVIRSKRYDVIAIHRGHDIIQSWIGASLSWTRPVLMYTPQVPEFINSRFLLSRMQKIVTISRYIRDKLVSFYPAMAGDISIIYYGIDLNKFKPETGRRGMLKTRFGLPPQTRILGTVGDLWKNQIEFLDSFAIIKKIYGDVKLVLVAAESGIGQISEFKDRAAVLGLTDDILWAGRLSKEEMLSFYADIDVAVSTHRNEGFGIWILEALAMGNPVIAFNEGGIRDSLEECPGGVLVKGGAKEMAQEIIKVLSDDRMRSEMSAAGKSWVADRFSRERMVEDYFKFFSELDGVD